MKYFKNVFKTVFHEESGVRKYLHVTRYYSLAEFNIFLKKILHNSDRIELFRTKFYSINNSDFIKT